MFEKGVASHWLPLHSAIEAPWLQLHMNDRHFLMIDFDDQGADAWKKLPLEPNFISYNISTGNHQAFFWLRDPVHCHDSAKTKKPFRYLCALEAAIDAKFGGDVNFSRTISKNPISKFWDTDWRHSKKHTLSEIEKGLELNRSEFPFRVRKVEKGIKASSKLVKTERNSSVFDAVRFRAYKEVSRYKDIDNIEYEDWHRVVLSWAQDENNFEDKKPLSLAELSCIAKSISKWTWNRYKHGSTRKKKSRKKMSDEELKKRQSLAAQMTNKSMSAATEAKVKLAIDHLISSGKKPTKSAVARIIKISREQVSKKYGHLFPK